MEEEIPAKRPTNVQELKDGITRDVIRDAWDGDESQYGIAYTASGFTFDLLIRRDGLGWGWLAPDGEWAYSRSHYYDVWEIIIRVIEAIRYPVIKYKQELLTYDFVEGVMYFMEFLNWRGEDDFTEIDGKDYLKSRLSEAEVTLA